MHAGTRNRAAIIGVGAWGVRLLVHLWPRLGTVDQVQAMAPALLARSGMDMSSGASGKRLPAVRDLVSFAMVVPGQKGELIVARPRPDRWDDVSFAQQRLLVAGENGASLGGRPPVAWQETFQMLRPTLEIVGEYPGPAGDQAKLTRLSLFEHFRMHRHAIARDLAVILEPARADESRPDEEAAQLTLFVVASLADGPASSVLWPLAYALRERVGDLVLTEQVGLLSAGIYAMPSARQAAEAAVYVTLSELNSLTSSGEARLPKPFNDLRTRGPDSVPQPPFDRVYLVDREKSSGALVKDEGELTTVVGNCLKAFLASGAQSYLRDMLAPDATHLFDAGPYSSFGAASVYVPLDEMWTQARQRLTLELLRDRFLVPASDEALAETDALAESFAATYLEPGLLCEPFIEEGPVTKRGDTEQVKASASGQSLPPVRVQVPTPGASPAGDADDPGNEHLAIQQQFDRFERGPLADWATQGAVIGDRLAEDGDAQGEGSLLKAIDQQVLALIMGQDQGVQLARLFVSTIHRRVLQVRQSLLQAERLGQGRLRQIRGTGPRSGSSLASFLLDSTARWSIFLGALALAAVIVAMFALSNSSLSDDALLAAVIGVGLAVLVAGVAVRTILLRWLRLRGADPATQRQQRIDELALMMLAGNLGRYLDAVGARIALREQMLTDALDQLERRRDELATRLTQPIRVPHSFVRQPLIGEEIYQGTRLNPAHLPERSVAAAVFRPRTDSALFLQRTWRQALTAPSSTITTNGGAASDGPTLGEVVGLAVERYAGRITGREIGADVDVESLLLRSQSDHTGEEFLTNLWQRAKPLIHLDDRVAVLPTRVGLLVVPEAGGYAGTQFDPLTTTLRLRLLSSHDPYSLTLVRTLHGFPLEAVANLRAYEAAFASLSPDRQKGLVLADGLIKKARRRSRRRAY